MNIEDLKQNKKMAALAVLVVIALISFIYGVSAPPRGKSGVVVRPEPSIEAERARPIGTMLPTKRHSKKTEFKEWGRNPFAPGSISGPASNLTLNGIIWDSAKPKAMINNSTVSEGDKIGGYTVKNIESDKVILRDGEEELVLKLE